MNNYAIGQASETSSCSSLIEIPARLMIGALLILPLGTGKDLQIDKCFSNCSTARIEGSSRTFGQYANTFTGEYENSGLSFEESVAAFYAQLLAEQEPLGKEFEKILYDNFDDLLVYT